MDPDSVAANSTAADLDAYFPGHLERPSTSVRTELLHQRTRDIVESFTHDGVISTFQPVDLVQQRRDKLRQLKHISRLEHDLLQKNGQSEELREEIQELKTTCDKNFSQISSVKLQLQELLRTEAPLLEFDFTPTTVEGTFELPRGKVFSRQALQLKSMLDQLCHSTYHILKRHLPPLEQRCNEVQREIWTLSETLAELQPVKKPIETEEGLRQLKLGLVAQFRTDKLLQAEDEKQAHKHALFARLEAERQEVKRLEEERERTLLVEQAKAEKRAYAHVQEEKRQEEELRRQRKLLEEQKQRALANVASIVALNRKRAEAEKEKRMRKAPTPVAEFDLENTIRQRHEDLARERVEARRAQEMRELNIIHRILDDEERRRAKEVGGSTSKRSMGSTHVAKNENVYSEKATSHLSVGEEQFEIEQKTSMDTKLQPLRGFSLDDADSSDEEQADRTESTRARVTSGKSRTADVLGDQQYSQLWEDTTLIKSRQASASSRKPSREDASLAQESRVTPSVNANRRLVPKIPTLQSNQAPAFSFKPQSVEFKDFTMGRVYRKKVLVTNTSGRVNSFKLRPLPFELTPFFTFEHTPAGRLSAGMTTAITVVFHPPMDGEDNIHDILGVKMVIAPEDGDLIALPINSLVPKCRPDIRRRDSSSGDKDADKLHIDFGKVSIGDANTLDFEVFNEGFVGAKFWVRHVRSEIMPVVEGDDADGSVANSTTHGCRCDCMFTMRGLETTPANARTYSGQILGYTETSVDVEFRPTQLGGRYRSIFAVDFMPATVRQSLGQIESMQGGEMVSTERRVSLLMADSAEENSQGQELAPPLEGVIRKMLVLEGEVVELPIYAEKENFDMQWLKVDGTYREKIVIRNRTSIAQRFSIKVSFDDAGKISEEYAIGNRIYTVENLGTLEISPNVGFVQPNEPFAVWLKLKPSQKAFATYGNGEEPFNVKLEFFPANHHLPVNVSLTGRITNSAVSVSPAEIDFGTCTTSDGIVRSVRVASFSKLINRIGFVDQPDYVSVAPGDGFATLLPLESIDQEITFAPKIPGTYRFTLSVKTMDGRCAFIKCRGVANKPPMRFMSHAGNFLKFPSISVGDQVTVSTVIGFEDDDTLISSLAKKKTSYFEFALPQWSGYDDRGEIVWKWVRDAQDGVESSTAADDENSPLTIHPRVGKLQSGEKRVIHITFRPRWKHVLNKAAAEDRGKSSINSDSNAPLKLKQSTASALDSAELKDNIVNWKIPCFTSSASGAKIENDNDMVVFLQLEAFVTTPQFKLADAKSVKIDFGKVPVNEQSVQNVFLKCLLDRSVALSLRGLDPFGPFSVVEDLRELKPNYPAKYMLAFRPTSPIKFFETFEIASEDKATCISLKITGEGVLPSVVVEPRSKVLIVGDTLLGEHIQKSMAIHNVSPFSTKIRVNISTDGAHLFECSPTTATIAPGMRQEINVVFKPDHESDFLHAIALIHVEGFKKPLKMKVVGRCWSSSAFLTCDDETMVGRALATRPRDVENRTQMSSGDAILLEELLTVAEKSTASATTEQQESSAEEWLKQVASVETKNAWKATSMVAAGKLSGRAAADVTQAMTRERGTGLATEISAAKPTHALLKLALPLASTVQPGTLLSSSSRCQFVSISCPWKQVNKSTVASDFSSLSGSVLSLNDRASVDTYATPLFRMDSRRITISNAKPGSATIATSLITLPADPKSIGAAGATFSVELVNDLNTLGPMAQIWLQRERALTSKNDAVVIKDHGLKFVVEPVSGTVDFGTQLSITIGMTGPKSERLTQDTMPIASKSSAKEDKDAASAVAVVRVPLAVESLFKVSIKGGVQIVERKQAQPSADGVYQTSYNVVAAGVEQPPGGNSPAYSDTFAKSVHEAANERVWLVRVVSSFEPEGKRERS